MANKAYKQSILREIISSKARFISIIVIILLGVSFYAGIKSSGPDMNEAINKFYREYNLMDSKVVSPLGLTQQDLAYLQQDERILDVTGSHTIDVNLTNSNNLVRVMGYDDTSTINEFVVLEGRLPENPGEIALDERAIKLNEDVKIGDSYHMASDEQVMANFKETAFEIVGIVRNPMYIEKESRGFTPVGKGTIDYFAVINEADLDMAVYTELYVRFKNVQGLDAYSDTYRDLMAENNAYLEAWFSERTEERIEEVKSEVPKELATDVLSQLEKSSYYVFDRTDNQGYLGYKDAIEGLDNIASVLPLFFFLVAIMICLTTMTRMVEENRIEIGTLKALGYTDLEISWKYIIYATLASMLGSVLGIVIGCNVLPSVISGAYGSLYSLPPLTIYYYPAYIVQSMVLSILCTVGAALFVIRVELKSKPSALMQAKAPKIGKKILLERITPVWRRLSFNHKVTLRNIFRYKQRMLMTILGIAGCMALLVTGFGLKDAITVIVDQQFDKLWRYEAMVIRDENASEEATGVYRDTVSKMAGYEGSLAMHQEAITFEKEKMNKQTATLYVPQESDQLDAFVYLNDRLSGEPYTLSDEGVIINEKLAKLLGVSPGDTITLKDEDHKSYTVRVAHVAENYVMHTVYMSPTYYEAIFGQKPSYNTEFINFNEEAVNEDEVASKLLACDSVINVTLKSQMEKSTEETNDSMKLVMVVIIVSAGCLAFVVLYNLNNINVSERIRELSTIKVLGFYHDEVTMYILRENVLLTVMGIVAGSLLGKFLHAYIIQTAETDTMMMYPNISVMSYVYSALLTLFFSVIVMILMHIKIKKVNMIDALKSNE